MIKNIKHWAIQTDGEYIYLYDKSKITKSKDFDNVPLPNKYLVGVREDKRIVVRGTDRKSFPKLPNYIKEELINVAKEMHGDGEYRVMNK